LPFTALTCNVLADGYIRRDWYPLTPDLWLDPARRHPALAEHLAAQGADLLCLQEVETPLYALIAERLARAGYAGEHVLKGAGKPDGCATFWRRDVFERQNGTRLEFADANAARGASGHIALITTLRQGERLLGVANTHIKWDAPKLAPEKSYAPAQITEVLAACVTSDPACNG